MVSVLVIDRDPAFVNALKRAAADVEDRERGSVGRNRSSPMTRSIRVIGSVSRGDEAIQRLAKAEASLALLDLTTVSEGGLRALLKWQRARPGAPRFIGMDEDEATVHRAMALGIDECVMKPFDPAELLRRANDLVKRPKPSPVPFLTASARNVGPLEGAVDAMLTALGSPRHLKGYDYLLEAITAVVRDPTLLDAVTHRLYPLVALRWGSTRSRVERAIRTCIEATWTRGNLEQVDRWFPFHMNPARGKPTNAMFIARVAAHVRLAHPAPTRLPLPSSPAALSVRSAAT